MIKNVIIAGLVLLVLIIGGRYLFTQSSSPNTLPTSSARTPSQASGTPSTATTSKKSSTSGGSAGTAALPSLLTRGGNYTCSIQKQNSYALTTAAVYVSGAKSRQELRARAASGVTSNTITVRDGVWAYLWTEGKSAGTKIPISSPKSAVPTLPSGALAVDFGTSTGWDCHAWLVDQSMITPPSVITFTAE